ncbi:MAG TPA: NAD(+)/NADH kinase [Candidatus Ornithospirochaeta avicola]|uniref:NAD kinase n=1 Tax=Candidatus Ornithospirochaeta avicola TaxID=2840896 RepID=A0A9D1TM05_9SPIO|nr:NAD(+)/NADH kinase [Candidatus Ornithospirochaeta avicola]
MSEIKKVLIIANGLKEESRAVSKEISSFFEERNIAVSTVFTLSNDEEIRIDDDISLVCSLGGDGTVLYAARMVHEKGLPILPVNLGTFGYITEVSKDEWKDALHHYLEKGDNLSRRLMLKVSVMRNSEKVRQFYALNEVTISASGISKVVKLQLFLNNTLAGSFKSDGLIIASPTGSTGYSLAAGGPILSSSLAAFVITPICPFTLSNRPLVVSSDTKCKVKINENQRTDLILSADGQESFALDEDDEIIIEKSISRALLITSAKRNFIDVIREKLHWSGEFHA